MTQPKLRFAALDGMRGIAALVVMVYHYYGSAHHRWLLNSFLAVDFFFILSGFVVLHSYGEKLRDGMTARAYLGKRTARLFPLMALGILLGVPALWLAGGYSAPQLTGAVITNLLFLPALFHGPAGLIFPTDDPLWSIFFEMVASVAFIWLVRFNRTMLMAVAALMFIAIFAGAIIRTRAAGLHGIEMGAGFDAATFWYGFPRVFYGFVVGMLIYGVHGRVRRISAGWLYLALLAMLMLPTRFDGWYFVAALGVIAPALVFYGSMATVRSALAQRVAHWLGYLSYPVYCLHRPVLALAQLGAAHWHLRIPVQGFAVVVTLLAAYCAAKLVDRLMMGRRTAGVIYAEPMLQARLSK